MRRSFYWYLFFTIFGWHLTHISQIPLRDACLSHPTLLDLIILTIFSEKYKFQLRLNLVPCVNVGLLHSDYRQCLCSELRVPRLGCSNSSRRYIDVFRYRKPITAPSGMSLRINVEVCVSDIDIIPCIWIRNSTASRCQPWLRDTIRFSYLKVKTTYLKIFTRGLLPGNFTSDRRNINF